MAYETFNKAAVDKLVAERKQQRAGMNKQARSSGFWAGLFALFDTLSRMGNNSNTSNELETETRRKDGYSWVAAGECPETAGAYSQYDPNYCRDVGRQDWD